MSHYTGFFQFVQFSGFRNPEDTAQRGGGPKRYSSDNAASEAAPHIVKWRLTGNSPRYHVSEPIRTREAALIEARAILETGPFEIWVEGPDGIRIYEDEIIRANWFCI